MGTVAGEAEAELVRGLGAEDVIDDKAEDVVARALELTDGKGFDLVHELVISANLPADVRLLAKGGRIVCTGQGPSPEASVPIGEALAKDATLLFMSLSNAGRAGVAAIAAEIGEMAAARQGAAGHRRDAAAGGGPARPRAAGRTAPGSMYLVRETDEAQRPASVPLAVAADELLALLAGLRGRGGGVSVAVCEASSRWTWLGELQQLLLEGRPRSRLAAAARKRERLVAERLARETQHP